MEAAQPPAKRISVGEVISEIFSIYAPEPRRSARQRRSPSSSSSACSPACCRRRRSSSSACWPLIVAAGRATRSTPASSSGSSRTFATAAATTGRRPLLRRDPAILPLIGFGILFGIGVAIGFVLLIVPGLILLTFWSVGAPAIVVERLGAIDAFGRSWHLVRGDAWSVLRDHPGRAPDRDRDRARPRRRSRRRSATAKRRPGRRDHLGR